jgi:energy-coupling factor transporter ATP-binding protein EcfA2
MAEDPVDWDALNDAVARVFTPAAPIQAREFFSGRVGQLISVQQTIREPGQHAIVYGERGVGKTSMANILGQIFPNPVIRVPADSKDDFSTLWRKVFKRIDLQVDRQAPGFEGERVTKTARLLELVDPDDIDPDGTVSILDDFSDELVVVIDEFDRLVSEDTRRLVADTIKTFSDAGSKTTVVLVGVAHDVRELVGDHPSVERNLRQIAMPRMTRTELNNILTTGFKNLGMSLPGSVLRRITGLSQGFPHYTHLLGKYCALEAIELKHLEISPEDFEFAVESAIEDTHETIRSAYQTATMTTKAQTIFPAVLLAAALAPDDEYGTFRATDMVEPLRAITGKPYEVPNFTYNLGKLSSPERGDVLERLGPKRPRYRFRSPLMKPFILMKGFAEGVIPEDALADPDNSLEAEA